MFSPLEIIIRLYIDIDLRNIQIIHIFWKSLNINKLMCLIYNLYHMYTIHILLPGESHGRAWWTTVHGVRKSRTQLKWLSSSSIVLVNKAWISLLGTTKNILWVHEIPSWTQGTVILIIWQEFSVESCKGSSLCRSNDGVCDVSAS